MQNYKEIGRKSDTDGFTLIELLVVIAVISILAAILFPVFARARESARRASCMSNVKQIGLGIMQYIQDYDERLPKENFAGGPTLETGYPAVNNIHLWAHSIWPYVKSAQVFNCPSANYDYIQKFTGKYEYNTSYAYNHFLSGDNPNPAYIGTSLAPDARLLASIQDVAQTPMVADSAYYIMGPDDTCQAARKPLLEADYGDHIDCGGSKGGSIYTNNNPPVPRHLETFNMVFVDGHAKSLRSSGWVTKNAATKNDSVWVKWNPTYQD